MSKSVEKMKAGIVEYQYNPAGIQKVVLDMLTELSEGDIEVVDPTNPFVFCLESAAVMTSAFMAQNEVNARKQYPLVAQTAEDLYLHMSDRDYANRFAKPSSVTFSIMLSKDEAIDKMVWDPETGMRKLVIPRNTYITVANTVFSLQYPIEIRQLQHGGLQVVYDGSNPSPLYELTTNILDWEIRRSVEGDMIYFEFQTHQFSILSQTASVSLATDFRLDMAMVDQFYYARVYIENSAGKWVEIKTTHSDQVYDYRTVTAVLRVVDKRLTVRIPQIYINSGMVASNVRVDLYQTKGELEMILGNYTLPSYTTTWQAYDKSEETEFVAPLKTFRQLMIYSDKIVTGGNGVLSVDDLRSRVINNAAGAPAVPITGVQLETALTDQGYDVIKNIDVVTNRVFLATRAMPAPFDPKLITGASASIETASFSIDHITTISGVIDNGSSVTLTPDVIYKMKKGVIKTVTGQELSSVLNMPADQRALVVSAGNYLYTPFHYVLDMRDDEFRVRPYYFDQPAVVTKQFVSDNDTTLLEVGTDSYDVIRTNTGYALKIVTKSSKDYRDISDADVFVQLAYVPHGERGRAYLMGELIGKTEEGERIYQFDLSTNFNVDENHGLELAAFFLYNQEARFTKSSLLQDFDIIYSTTAVTVPTWRAGAVDRVLGRFLLPVQIFGVSHESLRIRFGYSLDTLWARSRSVVSTIEYRKWEVDVPRRYEKDIYLTDLDTGSAFTVDSNGELQYTILHHKDDDVFDPDNNPVYLHRVGDVMLDGNGDPIILNPRGLTRQVDLLLIEGVYWFATDSAAVNYKYQMNTAMLEWLTDDIANFNRLLLEQTRLYFHPKTTLGSISVMVRDGQLSTIDAGQAFRVTLYVGAGVFGNEEVRKQLSSTTILTISEMLKKKTVSVSEIQSELRSRYGSDVIDVQLSGLGGSANLHTLTVTDESQRCSIRKKLVALSDETLMVQEDVTIDFVRHEVTL